MKLKYCIFLLIILLSPFIIKRFLFKNYFFGKIYSFFSYDKPNINICNSVQSDLDYYLENKKKDNISITMIDSNGSIVVDHKGTTFRIPASNLKLITTAFSLSRLGPNYTIKTSLYKDSNNIFHLMGGGDPDLSSEDIRKITDKISNEVKLLNLSNVIIYIYDMPMEKWWPSTWSKYDKSKIYGAPLTKLAIQSNSTYDGLYNPINKIKNIIRTNLDNYNIRPIILFSSNNSDFFLKKFFTYKKLYEIKSSKLSSLISLANSESHNFTSEILLRHAANSWDYENINKQLYTWIRLNRLNDKSIKIYDASGLSRNNRATTQLFANLLYKINTKYYKDIYFSSMSLYGVRGTLADRPYSKKLTFNFLGKTGTLNKVRSITGQVNINKNPYYISIISNEIENDDLTVNKILNILASGKMCDS